MDILENLICVLAFPLDVICDFQTKYEKHLKEKPWKWNRLDTIDLIIKIVVSCLASVIAIKIRTGK